MRRGHTKIAPVAIGVSIALAGCKHEAPGGVSGRAPSPVAASAPAAASAPPTWAAETPPGSSRCGTAPACFRFADARDAFRYVLARDPMILGIGEAHAQKGTEAIASSTKRFTETLLPLLEDRASDVIVELWAPDPKCQKEVKAVASAQKPVVETQAATNTNEYVTLGTRAKALGMTPWLLRPTCDDFSALADAGDGALEAMLVLIKRLTLAKLDQLLAKNHDRPRLLVAYGGAMHNDVDPPEATRMFSFGPEASARTHDAFVELDLIVPEYVQKTDAWQKLPWFAAWSSNPAAPGTTTLYRLGDRSFVIVFPAAK